MNKNNIITALTDYEMLVVDQRNRLINMRIQTERGENPKEHVNEFAKINEEIYLKLKALSVEITGNAPDDAAHVYGKADSFLATLDEVKPGILKFTLPPLFSTAVDEVLYNEGMFTYYLVSRIIEDSKINCPVMIKPVIMFRHHVTEGKNLDYFYDGIDIKRAVEAIERAFFVSQVSGTCTIIHETIEGKDEPFCEVLVSSRKNAGELLNGEL